ncbi:hypothetical protein EAH76_09070 [Sphingomonas glacialis]|uniref:Phytanoyl-CoA dioxygenase n=1 Tax=Sphingomonas glacialis TaxID=658225 RepID=A0A502G0D6_9SPHN|nr:hypothetical protein EAH76_09070 [Sphingomonas glacialis]
MLASARRIAVRAPSYATYARERPGWVFLIVFGRLKWARWIERKLRTKPTLQTPLPASSDVDSPDADIVTRRLHSDGVCEGFSLSAATFEEIRTFANENCCSSRDADGMSFLPQDVAGANHERSNDILAGYYFSAVERSDAVNRLLVDPRLLAVARNYLGQHAKNIRVRLWWSFPARRFDDGDLRRAAQDRFHFDLNDWRTLKFFFYLTDVDEFSGPHLYIRGSHRHRGLRHQYTLFHGQERGDLESYYGLDMFTSITGPAGSGFSEDPFVFHTGTVARSSPRLILELEFGPYDPSPSYRYGVLG